MKKIILVSALIAVGTCMSFTEEKSVESNNLEIVGISGGKITLINDTSEKLSVHTGTGSVSLNPRGGKTSFSCNIGKKVKVDGDVVFTISDEHCGETVYLSEYL
jgi:RNase P/RNase MRP subunit p29